jgi:protein-S-isoprenylcysteine O-methyltransferase Ste14
MDESTIVLITATTFWAILEIWLILRDRRRGLIKTDIDGQTRMFNFISMVFSPSAAAAITAIPFLRDIGVRSRLVFTAGIGMMAIGLSLRIWSITVLGKYFRTTIGIETNQVVVQRGPYRVIRHPAYAGLIMICMGYGLALQNLVSFAIIATLPTIALLHRIDMEERVLVSSMEDAYRSYRSRTKKLIPGIW